MTNGSCSSLWCSVVPQPGDVDEIRGWMALCCYWIQSLVSGRLAGLKKRKKKHQSDSCARIVTVIWSRYLRDGQKAKLVFISVHTELLRGFFKVMNYWKLAWGLFLFCLTFLISILVLFFHWCCGFNLHIYLSSAFPRGGGVIPMCTLLRTNQTWLAMRRRAGLK